MAKKLADIEKYISNESEMFYNHLVSITDSTVTDIIYTLIEHTNVFLFSGIIRDFFLDPNKKDFRDIDLIIEDDLEIELIFSNLDIKKNSFGGYKFQIQNVTIDLWVIRKTWGLNNGQLSFEFDILNKLPKTTFFNFSSILFHINEKDFIIGRDFLRFLRDKRIEIVSELNPYPELCIVNSFYYKEKLNLPFGNKLKDYLLYTFESNITKLDSIQIKHFKYIKYSLEDLKIQIKELK